MEIEKAKKAVELIQEIEELSKFKEIIENRDNGTSVANFALRLNYSNTSPSVVFDRKYTPRFIVVAEAIVAELKAELEAL